MHLRHPTPSHLPARVPQSPPSSRGHRRLFVVALSVGGGKRTEPLLGALSRDAEDRPDFGPRAFSPSRPVYEMVHEVVTDARYVASYFDGTLQLQQRRLRSSGGDDGNEIVKLKDTRFDRHTSTLA